MICRTNSFYAGHALPVDSAAVPYQVLTGFHCLQVLGLSEVAAALAVVRPQRKPRVPRAPKATKSPQEIRRSGLNMPLLFSQQGTNCCRAMPCSDIVCGGLTPQSTVQQLLIFADLSFLQVLSPVLAIKHICNADQACWAAVVHCTHGRPLLSFATEPSVKPNTALWPGHPSA